MPRLFSSRKNARVPSTCCCNVGRGSLSIQVADRPRVAAHPAGRGAGGIHLHSETRAKLGILQDAQRLKPAARQQGRAVDHLHIDVVLGSGRRDLGLRRPPLLGELPFDPAAGDDQPAPLRDPCGRGAKTIKRFIERASADPVHFGGVGEPGADRVDMRVDQPGDDGAACKIDDVCGGPGQRPDFTLTIRAPRYGRRGSRALQPERRRSEQSFR